MKTALVINEGTLQVVFAPENDWDKKVIECFGGKQGSMYDPSPDPAPKLDIFRGHFAECRGGWIRGYGSEESLILRLDYPEKVPSGVTGKFD
jgi:hypothetical protein